MYSNNAVSFDIGHFGVCCIAHFKAIIIIYLIWMICYWILRNYLINIPHVPMVPYVSHNAIYFHIGHFGDCYIAHLEALILLHIIRMVSYWILRNYFIHISHFFIVPHMCHNNDISFDIIHFQEIYIAHFKALILLHVIKMVSYWMMSSYIIHISDVPIVPCMSYYNAVSCDI
jgi:hypothetical protein